MRPVEGFDQLQFAEIPVLVQFSIIRSAINTLG